ncbi:TRAP transporter permease [Ammoniphilus sp. CFH 90114]|uniref:TRAP transporter permease n=1 Tax=Ammoniphilus sp. CFH 90114 TaxID=2493665 RepID=UPI00100F2585|nr:TRAP transporter permease [Ammoniphilus sp. CFH 90114]RXT02802.1 TRAP transporter permease [Ammoniphilus sp. CFH 90114]
MQKNEQGYQEILKKYDRESNFRMMAGSWGKAIFLLAIAFSVFQLYTGFTGLLGAQLQRAIHLSFALCLVFLLFPATKKGSRQKMAWSDFLLAVLSVVTCLYIVVNFRDLIQRAGDFTPTDLVFGGIGILLVLEAARRVVGLPIVIVGGSFLLYCFFGDLFPGFLNHRGFSVERIISHMWFTTEGIFGIPLGVSASFIFLFLLFGAFLDRTGIGLFFNDLALAVAGRSTGGPAKVAIFSSALQGTISGSSVANVVGSGAFSIPMMKRLGYKPSFAAGVEAAASTGGQIMPPIMGAAAFLMTEFTGTPYIQIVIAATIPAMLYFSGIWLMVHFEAKKLGLRGLTKEEVPSFKLLMKERGHLLIPIVVILGVLLSGQTPTRAALYGIIAAVLAAAIKRATRMSVKEIFLALEQGARSALGVAVATAAAGLIVGSVTLTGVGLKMATGLVALAQNELILTMFFTMVASIILGMGAPTTANYVITATIAAPALVQLGVPVLAAHMFAFYFGIIADITPPVALAAFAASGIAKSEPIITGFQASRLALAAFIIPYMFVMSPELLLIDTDFFGVLPALASAVLGMVLIGAGAIGYFKEALPIYMRIITFIGGLMLIKPGIMTDIMGVGIFVLLIVTQNMKRNKKDKGLSLPSNY